MFCRCSFSTCRIRASRRENEKVRAEEHIVSSPRQNRHCVLGQDIGILIPNHPDGKASKNGVRFLTFWGVFPLTYTLSPWRIMVPKLNSLLHLCSTLHPSCRLST